MSADLPTDFEDVEHAPVWLDYWRRQLRLMDWDIILRSYGLKAWIEMGNQQSMAGCVLDHPETGTAWISVLDPADLPTGTQSEHRDLEHTIVHELLHLMLPVRERGGADADGERRINRVAQALVRERRARAESEARARRAEHGQRLAEMELDRIRMGGGYEHP